MAIRWEAEACELARDPGSGAAITRLTAAAMHSINIYYEQPYGTADSSRIAYLRAVSSDPRLPPGQQLCVADLETCRVTLVDDRIRSHWVATSPWSGHVLYLRDNGELIHLDLMTLEKRIALTHWPLPEDAYLWTATPDLRYMLSAFYDQDFHFNLVRLNLEQREWEVIFRHPFEHGHIQLDPVRGRDILLQRGRGCRRNHLGERRREQTAHAGATHVMLDLDGANERQLHIGEPWTAPSCGHASWVAGSGRMATPVGSAGGIHVGDPRNVPVPRHDPRHAAGNMLVVGPEDEQPHAFPAPMHLFNHASVSRCGRYFVADCFCHGLPGPTEIVIGNFETGRHAVLVADCGAQGGGPASGHVHPYLTADNRRVIYNADRHGLCQVHMASVPNELLHQLND
jgi:hypothetical protein